jgi:hypothetical protein
MQDPVGMGEAIVGGVAKGAGKAWAWASEGENWKKAAEATWDYANSPDKWAKTAEDAAKWVADNPRKIGNVSGEILFEVGAAPLQQQRRKQPAK